MIKYLKKLIDFFFKVKSPPVVEVHTPVIKQVVYKKKKKYNKKCFVTNKVSHTESEARDLSKIKTNKYLKIRPYKCPYCEFWHVTHKKDKVTFH